MGFNKDPLNSQDLQVRDDEAAVDDGSFAEGNFDINPVEDDLPDDPAAQGSRSDISLAGRNLTSEDTYKRQDLAQADTPPRTSSRILESSKRLREDDSAVPVSKSDQEKQKKLLAVGEDVFLLKP